MSQHLHVTLVKLNVLVDCPNHFLHRWCYDDRFTYLELRELVLEGTTGTATTDRLLRVTNFTLHNSTFNYY